MVKLHSGKKSVLTQYSLLLTQLLLTQFYIETPTVVQIEQFYANVKTQNFEPQTVLFAHDTYHYLTRAVSSPASDLVKEILGSWGLSSELSGLSPNRVLCPGELHCHHQLESWALFDG